MNEESTLCSSFVQVRPEQMIGLVLFLNSTVTCSEDSVTSDSPKNNFEGEISTASR